MTDIRRSSRTLVFLLACGGWIMAVSATRSAVGDVPVLKIGYLELDEDRRYEKRRSYTGLKLKQRYRPLAGAQLAIRESRIIGRVLKMKFALEKDSGSSAGELAGKILELAEKQRIRFFLIDAPAAALEEIGEKTRGRDILIFNISEPANSLRGEKCQPHVMHVVPSHAMLTDAMVQYLVWKKWRRVLVLMGSLPEDEAQVNSFSLSARRFGARIVQSREFVLSNDPREREKNNITLLTSGPDYDVVFLADSDGEFGRYVPYQTQKPRPVVGTEGLIASAWHWTWERHGAPQLNQRFLKRAKRRMQSRDWAAWIAVKAVIESVLRTKSVDFSTLRKYLKSNALRLDGYKGNPVNFRTWNNQLRQPILLHTHNAVLGRAPLSGFLHPIQNMDTLGFDKGESKCQF